MHNITHLFRVDQNPYAFDTINLIYCLLDEKTHAALSSEVFDMEGGELDTLRELVMNGYFYTQKESAEIVSEEFSSMEYPEYDTLNISFAPIHDCNFACRYCYAQAGKGSNNYGLSMSEEKIDEILNQIYRGRYKNYKKYKFDFVSGGEPLLAFDSLKYFLEQMRLLEKECGKTTSVLVVTNGSLLTEEYIKILDQHDIFLGISIDGPKEIHDSHRIYKNGRGTFDDVVKGIERLHRSDASSKIRDAWAMAVVARDTQDLTEVMELCADYGFKRMQMQILRGSREHPLSFKNSDTGELKKKYVKLFAHILGSVQKGDLSRLKMIANDNDSFGKFFRRLLLREETCYRCFAGKNKISITAGGDIYPCDSFCGMDEFRISSLYNPENTSDVEQQFIHTNIYSGIQCAGCWARKICGGDCYYNAYVINGNIGEPDPVICEMNQFFIEHAIDILFRIYQMDPLNITYFAKFLQRK